MNDYLFSKLTGPEWALGWDGFSDREAGIIEAYVKFMEAAGAEFTIDQIKIKFSPEDLRFYITGDNLAQTLAYKLEGMWKDLNDYRNIDSIDGITIGMDDE